MTMTLPEGPLGGPVVGGLELRDAMNGVFTDIDEGTRQVKVEFPHEVVDSYKTVFGPDAFRESFAKRLPVMCWQHDLREPIGHAVKAQVTSKANEMVGQFDDFDAVPLARRAFTQIDSGTLGDFSFGFKGAKYESANELGKGVRRIKEAHMAEFSPVTIGSIPGAKAVGLREDGEEVMELSTIMELRASGLITVHAEAELIKKYHPELAEHITVRDISGDDMDADDPSGAAAEDMVSPRKWDAQDSGLFTATGPNDESMRVAPHPDGGHQWSVANPGGAIIAIGVEATPVSAKREADAAVGNRADEDGLTVPESITASDVRAIVEKHAPGTAALLANYAIAIGLPTDPIFTRSMEDPTVGHSLVTAADSALSSAVEWVSDIDESELPNEVRQALALTRAAAEALDTATVVLNLRDDGDEDEDDGDLLPDLGDDGDIEDDDDDDAEQESAADRALREEAMQRLDRRLASVPD